MMLRADWLGRWLVLHRAGDSHRARLSAHLTLLRWPRPAAQTHTHMHSWLRVACVCLSGCCNLLTSPEPWTRNAERCAHAAWCDIAGYCNFCALSGGNRGGVSAQFITMDCLFLLIWTLPIPLVGCTSDKLLATLLSWNIIKACGTYMIKKHTHTHTQDLHPSHASA